MPGRIRENYQYNEEGHTGGWCDRRCSGQCGMEMGDQLGQSLMGAPKRQVLLCTLGNIIDQNWETFFSSILKLKQKKSALYKLFISVEHQVSHIISSAKKLSKLDFTKIGA